MVVVAEIRLADQSLPLVAVAAALPTGSLSVSHSTTLDSGDLHLTVTVDDADRSPFVEAIQDQSAVRNFAEIGETADGWLYQVTVVEAERLLSTHDPAVVEGTPVDVTITAKGIEEQKIFADYAAFSTLQERCAANDIPFELVHIASDPENPGERDQFGLTDKQYRAITVAFRNGYYDSPRTFSTDELAAELGVSSAAASERLRRAERQLLSETIGPQQLRTVLA
jgi:predicted DNA binding protein